MQSLSGLQLNKTARIARFVRHGNHVLSTHSTSIPLKSVEPVQAMLCVSSATSENVVYDMTKILFEQVDELRTVHTKANDITPDTALDGMRLLLHPGAIAYYEETGVAIPASLKG